MLKDLSFEEIQTYFKELDKKENSKFLKAQLYEMAKREAERLNKENQIENTYGKDAKTHVADITIIDDDLSIIKAQEKWNDAINIMYYPVVKMKRIDYAFASLDSAIIYGIAFKNKCENYGDAAIKLVNE